MIRHDKLNEYIESVRARPFDWSLWNCCHFAAGWVRELTDRDLLAAFPPFDSEASARLILEERGGLMAVVDSALPSIHPSRAMKGDLVLGNHAAGGALGICIGAYTAHVGEKGLLFFSTVSGIRAWRVE